MMVCTRCDGTGFLNIDQLPEEVQELDADVILIWLNQPQNQGKTDCTVCDCCGDGEESWYGIPGRHFEGGDHAGMQGVYAYNGGLPECN